MFYSLLTKLLLLTITATLVWWIGWPTAPRHEPSSLTADSSDSMEPHRPASVKSAEPAGSEPVSRPSNPRTPRARASADRVDINRANLDDLRRLPGVGEVLANRILQHRLRKGPFQSVDELLAVKGIGRKRLAHLREMVVVSETKTNAGSAHQSPDAIRSQGMSRPAGGPAHQGQQIDGRLS